MIENFAIAVLDSGLLEQLASVLEKRLLADKDDPTLLAKLGHVYRQLGRLEEAAEVYTRLSGLGSEDANSRYLRALLTGEGLPARPSSGSHAVPFALYRDYLPLEVRDALLSEILHSQAEFTSSKVDVEDKPEIRPQDTTSLSFAHSRTINRQFRLLIKASLPQVFQRLQMEPFSVEFIQVEVKAYRDGHFFRPHQDFTAGNRRRVNFSYFLCRQPRSFSGGDLLLYDTDFEKCDYDPKGFTRFLPEDNCLVFYPSSAFHEATTVRCPVDDFAASRFAIIGAIS